MRKYYTQEDFQRLADEFNATYADFRPVTANEVKLIYSCFLKVSSGQKMKYQIDYWKSLDDAAETIDMTDDLGEALKIVYDRFGARMIKSNSSVEITNTETGDKSANYYLTPER